MRIRDWRDVLEDVSEADADPDDWRAVVGNRRGGLGEDFYLAHPTVGIFQLKTFAKNPFDVRGVGTRVATSFDDDVREAFPTGEDPRRFAINQAPTDQDEATERARSVSAILEAHQTAPTAPADLFADLMEAVESPAHGPLALSPDGRPDALDRLQSTFDEPNSVLDDELEDLIDRSGVGRSIH